MKSRSNEHDVVVAKADNYFGWRSRRLPDVRRGRVASAVVVAGAGASFRHAGIGETDTSTVRATVKAIDMKTCTLTLVGPQGETKTLKMGEQVQNLAQVKPGDTVVARYYEFVAYVLAPPGTKLPDDILAVAGARATPGEMPAGGVEARSWSPAWSSA